MHHYKQVPMQNYSTVLDQTTWGMHLNFKSKIGSGEALLCGMQIFILLLVYMPAMRLSFFNKCEQMMPGNQMVFSLALQLINSLPMDLELCPMKPLKKF